MMTFKKPTAAQIEKLRLEMKAAEAECWRAKEAYRSNSKEYENFLVSWDRLRLIAESFSKTSARYYGKRSEQSRQTAIDAATALIRLTCSEVQSQG